jgi:hypothetical protein
MENYSSAHAKAAFELQTALDKTYLANDWKKYAEIQNKMADLFEQAGLPISAQTCRSAAKEVLNSSI